MAPSNDQRDMVQTRRVFAVFDQLRRDRSFTRLAAIDAEFYWRCCRLDFLAAIEPLRRDFWESCVALKEAYDEFMREMEAGAAVPAIPAVHRLPPTTWADAVLRGESTLQDLSLDIMGIFLRRFEERAEATRESDGSMPAPAFMVPLGDALDQYLAFLKQATEKQATEYIDFGPDDFAPAPGYASLPPFAQRILDVSRTFGLPYLTVLRHVLYGGALAPLVECWADHTNPEEEKLFNLLHLDVYSNEPDGELVAEILREHERIYRRSISPWPGSEVSVRLTFAFKDDAVSGRPFVRVTAGLPLPPADVVARAYDGIVGDAKGWRQALLGTSTSQQRETALRTWAVALLATAGWETNAALREVAERAGWERTVSQERFNQDRRLLVQRFPEARQYLYLRNRT